jgi:RimJ/RimL family protein N-acetyltransferase
MSTALNFEVASEVFPIGAGAALSVLRDGRDLRVTADELTLAEAQFDAQGHRLTIHEITDDPQRSLRAISALSESLFGWFPQLDRIILKFTNGRSSPRELVAHGLVVERDHQQTLLPELAMQQRDNWLADAARPPMPLLYVMTDGKRHPQRPPKPEGVVYSRFIPWLSQRISFRVANLNEDLHLLHRWLNDPRVDAFWSEAGDLEKHRAYLSKILADPHMLPLIGCFGGVPFGYFEVYWAKENRIAPFYDADDYDRGWHVVVGEDAYRGRNYITAWLPSLMHYMFLDDCRTQRIVGEPAAAHVQQLRNLELAGFAKVKNFDFPHKRATLVMLLRERFFGDRLWLPVRSTSTTRA